MLSPLLDWSFSWVGTVKWNKKYFFNKIFEGVEEIIYIKLLIAGIPKILGL